MALSVSYHDRFDDLTPSALTLHLAECCSVDSTLMTQLDELGLKSAVAQNLRTPITSYEKIFTTDVGHTLLVCVNTEKIQGNDFHLA
jgi:hypothetical protein